MFRFGAFLSADGGPEKGRIQGLPVSEPVEVLQDELGIPHIFAANGKDLVTAQGYIHARDRLWQMESSRRVTTARLAEAAGPALLELDHFSVLAGFSRVRRRAISALTPENRELLEAYAAGINAYIDSSAGRIPLEYRTLGIRPVHWSVEDLCGVLPLNAWFLQTNFHEELVALLARDRLDSNSFAEIFPSGPGAQLPEESFFSRYGSARVPPLLPAATAFYPELASMGGGSNNWAVRSGEGGLPMVANDPHLAMMVPSVWHVCHLSCPGMNVAGVAMPGVPGIIIGRNEQVAWAVTNVMTDIVDLYMVRIDPDRPTRYLAGGEWHEMEQETVQIPVRGQEPVSRTIYRTVHGPIITEVAEGYDAVAALKWYGTLPEDAFEDTTINGFFSLFRSRTVDDVMEAGRLFKSVGQNLVCGDTEGNIAWHATGLVPVRNGYSGRVPADGSKRGDGSSGSDGWTDFLPYDRLPSSKNPPEGYIATANNRTVSPDSPEHITYSWTAPYRRARIASLLEKLERPTLEDLQEIQRDVYVLQADRLLPKLLAFAYTKPNAVRAAAILEKWDRVADRASTGTLIFSVFLTEFERLLLCERLGKAYAAYISIAPMFYSAVEAALTEGNVDHLLEKTKYGTDGLGALCEDALSRSVRIVEASLGKNMRRWRWGRLHTYRFSHAGSTGPFTRWLLDRGPHAAPGTPTTVNVSAFNPANLFTGSRKESGSGGERVGRRREYQALTIPSMRFTASLADPDRTFIMAPMGQSGRPGNRHYDDMIRRWIEGTVVPLPLSRDGAERIARNRLTFLP